MSLVSCQSSSSMLVMGTSMPFVRVCTISSEINYIIPFHRPTLLNPLPLLRRHPILAPLPLKEKNWIMNSPFINGTVLKPSTMTLPLPNPATPLLRQHEMWLGQNIPSRRPLIKQINKRAFKLEWTSCNVTDKAKTYQ